MADEACEERVKALEIEVAQLQAQVKILDRTREAAEANFAKVKDSVRRIAVEVVPDALDEARRSPDFDMSVGPLTEWLMSTLRSKLNRLTLMQSAGSVEKVKQLRDAVETLQKELEEARQARNALEAVRSRNADLEQQLDSARAEMVALRQEKARLEEALRQASAQYTRAEEERRSKAGSAEAPPVPQTGSGVAVPWLGSWKESPTYEQEKALLRIMGTKGYCLRSDLEKALEAETGARKRELVSAVFQRARKLFADVETPSVKAAVGRTPGLWRLTDMGKAAFRQVFGRKPVKGEYERGIERHKNMQHFVLNLMARKCLVESGATSVDMDPPPVTTSEGRFDPDIAAVYEGKPIYVEAERGGKKREDDRDRKWNILRSVTDTFYVVVPSARVQTQLLDEITRWAFRNNRGVTVRMCNLTLWVRSNRDIPWTLEKRIGL